MEDLAWPGNRVRWEVFALHENMFFVYIYVYANVCVRAKRTFIHVMVNELMLMSAYGFVRGFLPTQQQQQQKNR